jgi:hypothetical protein
MAAETFCCTEHSSTHHHLLSSPSPIFNNLQSSSPSPSIIHHPSSVSLHNPSSSPFTRVPILRASSFKRDIDKTCNNNIFKDGLGFTSQCTASLCHLAWRPHKKRPCAVDWKRPSAGQHKRPSWAHFQGGHERPTFTRQKVEVMHQ